METDLTVSEDTMFATETYMEKNQHLFLTKVSKAKCRNGRTTLQPGINDEIAPFLYVFALYSRTFYIRFRTTFSYVFALFYFSFALFLKGVSICFRTIFYYVLALSYDVFAPF